MPVNTSTFIAKNNQSHFVVTEEGTSNITGDLTEIVVGSTGTGKFPAQYDAYRQSVNSWHLGSPDTGLTIPKNAIIDNARVRFVPSQTRSESDINADQDFRLLLPDGHWDRSRAHPLHQQQGASSYGPPLVSSSVVFDETLTNEIASTYTAGASLTTTFGSYVDDFSHTTGTTIRIPANTQVGRVEVTIWRLDAVGVRVVSLAFEGSAAPTSLVVGGPERPWSTSFGSLVGQGDYAARFTVSGVDSGFWNGAGAGELAIDTTVANPPKYVRVRLRRIVEGDETWNGKLYFMSNGDGRSELKRQYAAEPDWSKGLVTITWDMTTPDAGAWLGDADIGRLRFNLTTGGTSFGSVFDIESIIVDNASADPNIQVSAYELTGNGRQYALDSRIDSSDIVSYLDLGLFPVTVTQKFDFPTPIPEKPFGRWIGLMIEGDWFDEAYQLSHRIVLSVRNHDQQESYPSGTLGSQMIATNIADAQDENSFVGLYYRGEDVPVLYQEGTGSNLATPYPRHFGSILAWNGSTPLTWTTDVPIVYGDTVGDTADEPIDGSFKDEIQNYIDSAYYNPATGRYWLGMMFGKRDGINSQYRYYGPSGSGQAISLELDWHYPPDKTCSFGTTLDSSVVSGHTEVQAAVHVFGTESHHGAQNVELSVKYTVQSFDLAVEPAVLSTLILEHC